MKLQGDVEMYLFEVNKGHKHDEPLTEEEANDGYVCIAHRAIITTLSIVNGW